MLPSLVSQTNIKIMVDLASKCPPGNVAEIGVYKGGTAFHLYQACITQNRQLYLYDTFCGIPIADPIDQHVVGDFSDVTESDIDAMSNLMPNAVIVRGVFPKSIIDMGEVAFVHADCDQYQSVKAVIEMMIPQMICGGIIYFDDWLMPGVQKAIHESGNVAVVIHEIGKAYIRI